MSNLSLLTTFYITECDIEEDFKEECINYIHEEHGLSTHTVDHVSTYTIEENNEAKINATLAIFNNVFDYYEFKAFPGCCFDECDIERVCSIIIQTIERFGFCHNYRILESFIENLVRYYDDFGTVGSDRKHDFDYILKKFIDHFAIPEGLFEYGIPKNTGPMYSRVNRKIYDTIINGT